MDWFSWLSKTSLDPSLVYEYGVVFAHNELEQEDIVYFNHEFLQSMGISIAKHRLEILKLAKKEKPRSSNPVVSRLIGTIKKTKKCLSNYIHSLIHREKSALVVVPTKPTSDQETRWKSSMVKRSRSKKLIVNSNYKQERLLLTNGNSAVVPTLPVLDGFSISSPKVKNLQKEMKKADEDDDGDGDGYWSAALEEIRWDAMFQDLKPN
ncbi:uncharacterized protein LOC129301095 [Prosopis cineraria]|uniref:uncharacterized protein LOC129289483 n=1 Tax=Prosopis cineraria TaxID=364024 RepID=UPI00240EDDFF|nr:uncharacterized protein LOC129289483 [Prosopis cineraria]XP_054795634.1 uncharacterized protein LOC129301095 [Prosopis cineraria]